MKLFGRELSVNLKTLVVLVAALLVASGLCGLQSVVQRRTGGALVPIFILFGIVESIAMFLSAVGIVVLLLMWVVRVLHERIRRRPKDEE